MEKSDFVMIFGFVLLIGAGLGFYIARIVFGS